MIWRDTPTDLILDRDSIDVWQTRIDLAREKIEVYADTLSSDEQARARKFHFPDKADEYIVTRGLLRQALGHVFNTTPTDFVFEYSDSKKPELKELYRDQKLVFNVSHSHGQALVALGLKRQLGIDIEKIREDIELEKLAKRFFSDNEHQALMQYEGSKVEAFFATWTRKEAFVKAVGKGIAFGLSQFDVNIDPDEEARMLKTRWDESDLTNWHMKNIDIDADYKATVVADTSPFNLRCWRFN